MKGLNQFVVAATASLLLAAPAFAVGPSITFAQFTQQSSDKIVSYGVSGGSNTLTIAPSPSFMVVTDFGPAGIYNASVSMSASSSAPVINTGPQFEQAGWNGSISFSNGGNLLTAQFMNAVFNYDDTGGSASLIATDPFDTINYSSDFLNLPAFNLRDFSLSFTGITPPFSVGMNGLGAPFAANIAGSFAGSAVPEPSTWAMLVLGFGLVGWSARRRTGMAALSA